MFLSHDDEWFIFGLAVYLLARASRVICQTASFQHTFQFLFTFDKRIGDVLRTLKLFMRFSHCLVFCSLMGCMGNVGRGRLDV